MYTNFMFVTFLHKLGLFLKNDNKQPPLADPMVDP